MKRLRVVLAAWLGLLAAGCTPSPSLDVGQAERLAGVWDLRMRSSAAGPRLDSSEARGQLDLVVNRARTRVPGLGGVPLNVGVHNLDLRLLDPSLAQSRGVPGAAGGLHGDSLRIFIAPGSAAPIRLDGVLIGTDSAAGRWSVWGERVVVAASGTFVMRRR
jgi:hypothetical protein